MSEQLLDELQLASSPASDLTYFALAATAAKPAAQAPREVLSELPEVLGGRYKIERLLGVGGMGAVYRARDLLREQFGDPEPYVALKTLSDDFAEYPDASALLYSEFALTARLSHRNLVRFYSFEVDPTCQRAFITMELLKGCTLDSLLQQYPSGLPWAEARTISLSLLEAEDFESIRTAVYVHLKEDFAANYIFPMIQAGAIYEGRYLLGTSIARIPTARGQMRYARRIGGNVLVQATDKTEHFTISGAVAGGAGGVGEGAGVARLAPGPAPGWPAVAGRRSMTHAAIVRPAARPALGPRALGGRPNRFRAHGDHCPGVGDRRRHAGRVRWGAG